MKYEDMSHEEAHDSVEDQKAYMEENQQDPLAELDELKNRHAVEYLELEAKQEKERAEACQRVLDEIADKDGVIEQHQLDAIFGGTDRIFQNLVVLGGNTFWFYFPDRREYVRLPDELQKPLAEALEAVK